MFADTAPPRSGSRANLADFGFRSTLAADANRPGWYVSAVEWDEARDVHEVRYRLSTRPSAALVEYWVHTWPPKEGRGGWTTTDSPYRGEWRAAQVQQRTGNGVVIVRFGPLTINENPNLKERAGYAPAFRRTLKIRLAIQSTKEPDLLAFEVYGLSTWNRRTVRVRTGCEGKPAPRLRASAYNGRLLGQAAETSFDVAYLEHEPATADRTVLQLDSDIWSFGIAIDDLIRHRTMYVRDLGVFITDGQAVSTLEDFLASDTLRTGQDVHSRVTEEQSMERARGEIPMLSHTGNNGRHPVRYVPLGFPGNREKLALEYNGNVFISKHGAKTFDDERARLIWEGDKIRFRFGSGAVPDFRERPASARQRPSDVGFVTEWTAGAIAYTQEAFAGPYESGLDPWTNRGDERAAAFVTLRATNTGASAVTAYTWLDVSPEEPLSLTGVWLHAPAGVRAWLKSSGGSLHMRGLAPESTHSGKAVVWQMPLEPGASATLDLRIPFRTPVSFDDASSLQSADSTLLRARLADFWRQTLRQGMRLRTPDALLNRFYDGVTQHILASVYRDPSTGLFMAPCGTYDYNMFLNETNMQVRLLDMRGLHDMAARFLEPALAMQGSKPFPGMFRSTDAIFHGVRIDEKHDYTHSGYNLNHGWTLWTLAEHYWFSRDREWLRAKLPNIRKAARWIVEERAATTSPGERGMLPPGQLEDNEEWRHWFAVNAYAYKGLKAAAEVIAELDPEEGARLREESAAYRSDLRAAIRRAMAASPVVPRGDGTWIPYIPSRSRLHGPDHGWIRNILYGAHSLIDGEVIDPSEQWATWIMQDLEDNRFMAADSFSVAEQDWFSRGGITLQPNLVNAPLTYLARNEIPHALRAFYNTFAASYFEDVNAFAEWVPSFGRPGGPYFKTSDEAGFLAWLRMLLLREDGHRLELTRGAPRRWFRHGEVIDVRDAATFFGKVSFRIESRVAENRISATIEVSPDFRAKEIVLTLRHPDKKSPRRALAGTRELSFDRRLETISVPVQTGTVKVEVDYD